MLSTRIGEERRFYIDSDKFKVAFDFLKRKDLAELPEGWIDLSYGVRVSVQRYNTINPEEAYFESHEKYYDVQYVIEGKEYCGITNREGLVIRTPYDAVNDISFYEEDERSYSKVFLEAGDFVILAPSDVHKPRLVADKKMEIKKLVIKVPV